MNKLEQLKEKIKDYDFFTKWQYIIVQWEGSNGSVSYEHFENKSCDDLLYFSMDKKRLGINLERLRINLLKINGEVLIGDGGIFATVDYIVFLGLILNAYKWGK